MNLKKMTRMSDSRRRVEDMRSGGSGSLRSSIFNRSDEVITDEMVEEFYDNFADLYEEDIDGGPLEGSDGKKQVMKFFVEIPDVVPVGSVEARLAKVNYNKEKHLFEALYRPKNGRWGQGKSTGRSIKFK